MIISIPGSVYYDYLDPMASSMAQEIGLAGPDFRRRGRSGASAIYNNVSRQQAQELVEYLTDRAMTLLGQDDEHRVHRAALRCAQKIQEALNAPGN